MQAPLEASCAEWITAVHGSHKADCKYLWELAKAVERVDVGTAGALKAHQAVIVEPDLLHSCQGWLPHICIISAWPTRLLQV